MSKYIKILASQYPSTTQMEHLINLDQIAYIRKEADRYCVLTSNNHALGVTAPQAQRIFNAIGLSL